jgi:predicted nucleic acid-binding protein
MYNGGMERKVKRVYVDSSAVGGKFNTRIAKQTKPFWDAVDRGEIVVIVSDMLEREVRDTRTPQRVKDFFDSSLAIRAVRIMTTDESRELALRYIAEDVVDQSSYSDCLHVALATLANADVIVSWSLTHMVEQSKKYKNVNKTLGYPEIEILTPEKFMEAQQ